MRIIEEFTPSAMDNQSEMTRMLWQSIANEDPLGNERGAQTDLGDMLFAIEIADASSQEDLQFDTKDNSDTYVEESVGWQDIESTTDLILPSLTIFDDQRLDSGIKCNNNGGFTDGHRKVYESEPDPMEAGMKRDSRCGKTQANSKNERPAASQDKPTDTSLPNQAKIADDDLVNDVTFNPGGSMSGYSETPLINDVRPARQVGVTGETCESDPVRKLVELMSSFTKTCPVNKGIAFMNNQVESVPINKGDVLFGQEVMKVLESDTSVEKLPPAISRFADLLNLPAQQSQSPEKPTSPGSQNKHNEPQQPYLLPGWQDLGQISH